jgi:hypothetical protein
VLVTWRRHSRIALVVAVVYGALKLVPAIISAPFLESDSPDYLRGPSLTGRYPPVPPLLFSVLAHNLRAIVLAQAVLSTGAWLFLAAVVGILVRSEVLQAFIALSVLAFSLMRSIASWDIAILSESLAVTLFVALVAVAILIQERPTAARTVAFAMLGVLFTFTRDTAAFVALMIAIVIGVLVATRRAGAGLAAVGVVFVAMFAIALALSNAAGRGTMPFYNITGTRILTDAARTRYFVHHGMPFSAALEERRGSFASGDNDAFFNDPRLAAYRHWADENGQQTYLRYALTHPVWSVTEPFREAAVLLPTNHAYAENYRAAVPNGVDRRLLQRKDVLYVSFAAVVVFAIAVAVIRRPNRRWLIPAFLVGLAIPATIAVWHGDTEDLRRHGLEVAVQLRVGLLLLFAVALDAVLGRVGAAGEQAGPNADTDRPLGGDAAAPRVTTVR